MGKETAFCFGSKVSCQPFCCILQHPALYIYACLYTTLLHLCRQLRYAYAKLLLQTLAEGGGDGGLLRDDPPYGPLKPLPSSKKAATVVHHHSTKPTLQQQVSMSAGNSLRTSPQQSHLPQPGWAKHSPILRHQPTVLSSRGNGWVGERLSHQEEEHSDQESAPSLRGLSLEDLINVSDVHEHSKHKARSSPRNEMHGHSRTVSFDLDSSLEDLRKGKLQQTVLSPVCNVSYYVVWRS